MRVKYISEKRIYWSLGRGQGDQVVGVEVSAVGEDRVKRTVFSRGKFGRETKINEEEYSVEEFLEILGAERTILKSKAPAGNSGDGKELLLDAIEMIRRVYNGL
ncbi:MAG: hypothetical protein WHS82_05960 [Candidatus Methanosuratincola sp.]